MTLEEPLKPRIPVSTYRLRFNGCFTFTDAGEIVSSWKYGDATVFSVSEILASFPVALMEKMEVSIEDGSR